MKILNLFLPALLLFTACEKKKNSPKLACEYIYRKAEDHFYTPPLRTKREAPSYPWDHRYVGGHFRITKEFFRCKGSSLNPIIQNENTIYIDCTGDHSLPLKENQEFVYPQLLRLLNYIQEKTEKEVVITTGHRCAKHNQYADRSGYNQSSMHMMGAEVDFYVKGMESSPEKIIALIEQYYQEDPEVQKDPLFTSFKRYTKDNVNVRTQPWYNQEIFVKLYQSDEGRDLDNQHLYPYLSIQMRYDRDKKSKVQFVRTEAELLLREN